MLLINLSDEITTKSNADILEDTYYDYHGKHDDGNHVADEVEMSLGGGYAW